MERKPYTVVEMLVIRIAPECDEALPLHGTPVTIQIYGPWRACYDDLRAALGALDDARLVAH